MPTITSAGVGSGLDVAGIVNQLMAVESRPLLVLDQKEVAFQARLSAYGTLKSALTAYQSAMRDLSSVARFQSISAQSADASIYTATAGSDAVPGSYAVEVKQLAQAHKLASSAFAATSDALGTGTLTFQFGTYSGGVFSANADKPSQTVTIAAGSNSLAGVRDAINAAKIGVSAAILNDGTGYKLVLSGNDTGSANSLKITVSGDSVGTDTDTNGLSQLAYDPEAAVAGGKNLTGTQVAQDARLKVDGLDDIYKSGNVVTDVIQGVTLTLKKQSAVNTPTALSVARDTGSVKGAIENFVKAYNDANATIAELTAYNASTGQAAILQGDFSTLSISNQIRRTLTSSLSGLAGSLKLLSDVGVAFQSDGRLAFDSAKLQTALDNNFDDIAQLFAAQGRPSDSLVRYVGAGDKTQAGRYLLNVTQLAAQGVINGASTGALAHTGGTFTAPFTIDADNDGFAVKIDGVQTSTVSLANGSYLTGAALSAEIQSKINGDSALKAAGVTVTVSFDTASSRLVIHSSRYGSASTVEITSIDTNTATTLGLSVAAGTDGVDVAGTLNGAAANGAGRTLTGTGGSAADGLKIDVIGGATGDRGQVDYSLGYAYQLDKLVDQLLASSGPVASRQEGLNRSIEDIGDQRVSLERRLADIERRYRAQFAALDTLLGQLRVTSDYLTQQLATLPGVSGGANS